MRMKLTNTALLSQRFWGIASSQAAIPSSVLHNVGLVTKLDISLVIDKNKIARDWYRTMPELKSESLNIDNDHLVGLYFDDRCDKTL